MPVSKDLLRYIMLANFMGFCVFLVYFTQMEFKCSVPNAPNPIYKQLHDIQNQFHTKIRKHKAHHDASPQSGPFMLESAISQVDMFKFPNCRSAIEKSRNLKEDIKKYSFCESLTMAYDIPGEPNQTSLQVTNKQQDLCPHPITLIQGALSSDSGSNHLTVPRQAWRALSFVGRPYSLEHIQLSNVCFFDNQFHFIISRSEVDLQLREEDLLCMTRMNSWSTNSPFWDLQDPFWRVPKGSSVEEFLAEHSIFRVRGSTYLFEQMWSGYDISSWQRAISSLFALTEYNEEEASHITQVVALNGLAGSDLWKKSRDWQNLFLQAVMSRCPGLVGKEPLLLNDLTEPLWIHDAVCFDQLVVMPHINRRFFLAKKSYARLTKRMREWAGDSTEKENLMKKLFVLRDNYEEEIDSGNEQQTLENTFHGRALNEMELIIRLQARFGEENVLVLNWNSDLQEQIKAAAVSWGLISFGSGVGLANVLFMEPKSLAIEIVNVYRRNPNPYYELAELGGVQYQEISQHLGVTEARNETMEGAVPFPDFMIDIDFVEELLQKFQERLQNATHDQFVQKK